MATSAGDVQDYSRKGFEYGKQAFGHTSTSDSELWGLLTDVPKLNGITALICAILNVGISGFGTIVAGCIADKDGWNKTQIFIGLLQLMTSVYIVGWLASLYWSYLLMQKASRDNKAVKEYLAHTEARA